MGVHRMRATGHSVYLGSGSSPAWQRGSRNMAYKVCLHPGPMDAPEASGIDMPWERMKEGDGERVTNRRARGTAAEPPLCIWQP